MLRLAAPDADAGAGVETGGAEGELEEPPQDGEEGGQERGRGAQQAAGDGMGRSEQVDGRESAARLGRA